MIKKIVSKVEFTEATKSYFNNACDEVIQKFDFERATKSLEGCSWKYSESNETPSPIELRKIALSIVKTAMECGEGCEVSQGPLRAIVLCHGEKSVLTVRLSLVPIWSYAVYVDAMIIYKRRKKR